MLNKQKTTSERPTISNIDSDSEQDEKYEVPDDFGLSSSEQHNIVNDTEDNVTAQPFTPIEPQLGIKRGSRIDVGGITNNERTENNDKEKDDIDAFLTGIAATMRKFDPYHINLAKTKIFTAVQDIDMQQIINNQRQQSYIPLSQNNSVWTSSHIPEPAKHEVQNLQSYQVIQQSITNLTSHESNDEQPHYQNMVYRSPNGNANIFLEQLQDILFNITTENKNINIIFCGDINIDLLNNNRLANNYLDLMTSYGFTSYVNSPTRVWEDNAIILKTSITDHFPIFIQIMPYTIQKSIEITDNLSNTRKFFNKNNFKSLINNETWNNTPTTASINTKFNFYGNKIKQCNNNPKKIWKTINEATIGQNNNNKNNNLHINIENNIYSNKTHPEKNANYFNNYFAKITTKNLNELMN
ncbi:hypothetical protein QTP88_022713 [Uroleucon formosanum]